MAWHVKENNHRANLVESYIAVCVIYFLIVSICNIKISFVRYCKGKSKGKNILKSSLQITIRVTPLRKRSD